ncbi:hypothetical protein BT96DRAFT_181479 [Gymnopus androsaceus JB14]|uniref:Uncharacterized protein n=1 Tax=Gymnopus androsaceus JB14 TaxID=1447944 RepID=A0A6A4HA88_9AGAR|nr:hypothetical protein BT96DRAFT_181479 [Gymnopus androsaceus JB14]
MLYSCLTCNNVFHCNITFCVGRGKETNPYVSESCHLLSFSELQRVLMDFFPMLHSHFIPADSFDRNIGFCTGEVPGGDSKLSRGPLLNNSFAFYIHPLIPPQCLILGRRGTKSRDEVMSVSSALLSSFLEDHRVLMNLYRTLYSRFTVTDSFRHNLSFLGKQKT